MKTLEFLKSEVLKSCQQMACTHGYKYWICEDFVYKTNIRPKKDLVADFVALRTDGWLLIEKGFAYDGPSGCTIDTDTNMRAALVHDAVYYLLRQCEYDQDVKDQSDQELHNLMIKDGAYGWRARIYRWAVSKFGKSSANKRRKVYKHPKLKND